MKNKDDILLKESDSRLLKSHMSQMLAMGADAAMLDGLKSMMDKASVVADHLFPAQTVALDRLVEIEYCDDGERAACRLVLPNHVSRSEENVSVASPLGLVLLGRHAGQTINWPLAVGHGVLQVKILQVGSSATSQARLCHA